MSFEKRLEKTIAKKQQQIEKEQRKIEALKEKLDNGKITRATYSIKKGKIEAGIRSVSSRMRVLQGGLTREKRHQEEASEEKQKKKEEKQKKKEKKKKS